MTNALKDVDVVCHAAAYAHEGLSSFSPKLICNNNVTGSTSVFTAAIINKVKRIVYCSSMARYGEVGIPFTEEQIPNPIDHWAPMMPKDWFSFSNLATFFLTLSLSSLGSIKPSKVSGT